uniref:GH16 domain-containing protein n=1 Tax=Psilocybe cubensis TaxID=181762 RepID=A0A8H7XY82_PSICU
MGNFGLIDLETPKEALIKKSMKDGSDMILVFSDEFNEEGRTFYPGDDPYWEAEDLHYWATNNLEWYDPEAITTSGGALVITFSEKETHDLGYQGGLMSSWNKFCFTGGYIETAVQLPGRNNVVGMWPAVWTMGNLGRAGYGASLEGMWPYTYDSCDVGTAPNQTFNGGPLPALVDGDHAYGGALSYLPGQRLSRCTCDGESHPGPKHEDGTYVGRSAPEIDVLEAQVGGTPPTGEVSQSAQWAYISWVSNGTMSWTLNAPGLGPDPSVEISARPVPQEPMYIIVNLGMSKNFGSIDFEHLTFPTSMRIDYIRVYQDMHRVNIGCDPTDFPTADYINTYIEAYTNPNLTTWRGDYGKPFPKNSFIESC